MNRRLIRPSLSDLKDKMKAEQAQAKKKIHPSFDTFAENYYYLKQMNKRTAIAVVLADGEKVEGTIEWYDRNCIKLNREVEPNLLIYKCNIKYLYKLDEGKEGGSREPDKKE